MTLRIAVAGASGRLGGLIAARVAAAPDLALAARIVRPGTADGDSTDDVAAALGNADLLIEATRGGAVAALAAAAAARGIPFISGTTGLDDADRAALDAAAKLVPVLHASNFATLALVLAATVERLARLLPPDAWDIEIVEMHHRGKEDAPSGTALDLARAAARGRGIVLEGNLDVARHGRTGARRQGTIGIASVRGGGGVGETSIGFAGDSGHLWLTSRTFDRGGYAEGALRAARFLAGRQAGRYSMAQVLGLDRED